MLGLAVLAPPPASFFDLDSVQQTYPLYPMLSGRVVPCRLDK